MNPSDLVSGEKYLYSPVVPSKYFCSLEQKREPEILTYSKKSPYAPHHIFWDKRGEGFAVCLEEYIIKEQVEPLRNVTL
jgi:hypothetical protein